MDLKNRIKKLVEPLGVLTYGPLKNTDGIVECGRTTGEHVNINFFGMSSVAFAKHTLGLINITTIRGWELWIAMD